MKEIDKVLKYIQELEETSKNVIKQDIVDTLPINYLPYAKYVICDRAIVGIDGMKPVHRRILWTMFLANLINGKRIKSANATGQVLKYHPHGDSSVYMAMCRMAQEDSLILPFVDGKGDLGEHTSEMSPADNRYTEVKLRQIVGELFKDIDKLEHLMRDNADKTGKEPILLPVKFPSILANPSSGIAVGMASSLCSFNLKDLCDTTIAYMEDPNVNLIETLKTPTFPTGGYLLYSEKELETIYETGRGSVKLRAVYEIDENGDILVTEIPYSTVRETIIKSVIDLIKKKTITEVNDIEDLTDIDGMKIGIEIKKGVDPHKLMQKLYKLTPLETSFTCNFNVLINGRPQTLGVKDILKHWLEFRKDCIIKAITSELVKLKREVYLIEGVEKAKADIEKTIEIVRFSTNEEDMHNKFKQHFGLDEEQSDYVYNIRLKNINETYFKERIEYKEKVKLEIETKEEFINSNEKIEEQIKMELNQISKKYTVPNKTKVLYDYETYNSKKIVEEYPVVVSISREGYCKKIKTQGFKSNIEHKVKDGDTIINNFIANNKDTILVFTNKKVVYRLKLDDLEDCKKSQLGTYLYNTLKMDKEEQIIKVVSFNNNEEGSIIVAFKDGRLAKISNKSYMGKRSKLLGSLADNVQEIVNIFSVDKGDKIVCYSSDTKTLIIDSDKLTTKKSRDTLGVLGMKLKEGNTLQICDNLKYFDDLKESVDYYLCTPNSIGNKLRVKIGDTIEVNNLGIDQQ